MQSPMATAEEGRALAGALAGPICRECCGSDCSSQGLMAYGCGSALTVVDVASLQLVHTLMYSDRPDSAISAVRFLPEGLIRDLAHTTHLRLAAGDMMGRIAIWDVVAEEVVTWLLLDRPGGKIEELCWVYRQPWLLAALYGGHQAILWDTTRKDPLWRYESGGEPLVSITSNPHDTRQVCIVGAKGLLLSLHITGREEGDVSEVETRLPSPYPKGGGGEAEHSGVVKCRFAPRDRGLLFVLMPREILLFDTQFESCIAATPVPRTLARCVDIAVPLDGSILYCLHADTSLSCWQRKAGGHSYILCQVEELVPKAASQVVALMHCTQPTVPLECGSQAPLHLSLFMALTDDGKLWQWKALAEPADKGAAAEEGKPSFTVELQGMLQALPSAITTLAVPFPSRQGTVVGAGAGGGAGAPAVPLVALATQGGSVELLDTATHAICASHAIHEAMVRGVRWLGNHKLVSFSFSEVKGKGGGYRNLLVVTCVRSGQSTPFRVLQQPERSPMRGLRTSPSGRYLLILFREAPAEVWAMTRTPTMLRSLALPFTVMEWALPPLSDFRPPPPPSPGAAPEEVSESFAFALVNGSLGVFELRGRRVREFRPKWPPASFVAVDVLVTAMAYRLPHVLMGDRLGNLRWWDVSTGQATSFNTHRGGIRRIRFAPTSPLENSRGRCVLLFNDRSFALFDLDVGEAVPQAVADAEQADLAVLELDWLPLQGSSILWPDAAPQLLCVAVADGSLRLLQMQPDIPLKAARLQPRPIPVWQRLRPSPLYSVALLPPPHALAMRLLLQQGVKPSWLEAPLGGEEEAVGDLRDHLVAPEGLPSVGETGVGEILLKTLQPHRMAGRVMEIEVARGYARVCRCGTAARCALVAAHFGDMAEAEFWLQLPTTLHLLSQGSAGPSAFWEQAEESDRSSGSSSVSSEDPSTPFASSRHGVGSAASPAAEPFGLGSQKRRGFLAGRAAGESAWGEQGGVRAAAMERIGWHERVEGPEATQRKVHEYVAVGDYEAAVTLLLASPPGSATFYVDALRAVALSGAVSPAMQDLTVKVVAASMVQAAEPLPGIHLLCAVGRYQEACLQLQDAGRWVDACTLAATHLSGSDRARVLERWGHYCFNSEGELWRALSLYVAAGALGEALDALQKVRQPDSAIMLLLACHEARQAAYASAPPHVSRKRTEEAEGAGLDLPGNLRQREEQVQAACDFFAQYQRWLAHLCTSTPSC